MMHGLLVHLKDSECEISETKTVIMGSTYGIRKEMKRRLQNSGWDLPTVTQAKDLGTDSTMGVARRTRVLNSRVKKARSRAVKIAGLTRQNKKAQRIVRPSVGATQSWGVTTMTASTANLRSFRSNLRPVPVRCNSQELDTLYCQVLCQGFFPGIIPGGQSPGGLKIF